MAVLFRVLPWVLRQPLTTSLLGQYAQRARNNFPALETLTVDTIGPLCLAHDKRFRKIFDYCSALPIPGLVMLAAFAAAWPELWFPDGWSPFHLRKALEVWGKNGQLLHRPFQCLSAPEAKLMIRDIVCQLPMTNSNLQTCMSHLVAVRLHHWPTNDGEDAVTGDESAHDDQPVFYCTVRRALLLGCDGDSHEDTDNDVISSGRRLAPGRRRVLQRMHSRLVTMHDLIAVHAHLAAMAQSEITDSKVAVPRPLLGLGDQEVELDL